MATKKLRLPKPKTPASSATVKVDAKLKALWDQTRATIAAAQSHGASAFDELWEAAGRAVSHEPPLYVFGDYASAADFFKRALHEEPRTAQRYIRVAKFASPQEEETYGVQKLDAAIGYLEAKVGHAVDGPLPVAFERLKIPVKEGKTTRAVPLAAATLAQLRAATRALRAGTPKKGPKSDVRDALRRAFAAEQVLAGIAVHEANGFVSFTHVPVGALAQFLHAVGAARTAFEGKKTKGTKSGAPA